MSLNVTGKCASMVKTKSVQTRKRQQTTICCGFY
nr:MAG TPA: hypothetical protein [Caudoviricetes sp.]DAZ26928.1 MAG TPA: hypothetical protein [Caudoviricetes sp.]